MSVLLIERNWQTIDKWLHDNAPEDAKMPPPLSGTDLDSVEAKLGVTLPKDVRASYQIHDGSNRVYFWKQGYLMPLKKPSYLPKKEQRIIRDVVESTVFMRKAMNDGSFKGLKGQPNGPIQKAWWHAGWIAISYNDSGDHLCIDLAPAKGGKKGQIIDWWHEQGATHVEAPGFAELLARTAKDFASCKYRYNDRLKRFVRV